MRRSSRALVWFLISVILTSCGGFKSHTPSAGGTLGEGQLRANASFIIRWPRTRVIPQGTNRLIIYVSHQQSRTVLAYIKDRTSNAAEETVSIPIPHGQGITFSADAIQVSSVKYTKVQRLPINHPDLREGTLLGSGHDGTSHDVAYGGTITATIEIKESGKPDPGTTSVDLKVNQIVTSYFPLVLVLELIRDQNGNPITNLNKLNFEVTEDGIPVLITDVRVVEQSATSLSICLVLDRSGSMFGQPNMDLEQAASTFVDLMQPNDYGAVINFSSRSSIRLSQDFTRDKSALKAAILGQNASGSTALYSAIWLGLDITSRRDGGRAIIAMSDGGDNDSDKSLWDVIGRANDRGIPIFTIGLAGRDLDEFPLRLMANDTGGLYFFAPTSSELEAVYRRIALQIRSAIQISFISPDPQPSGRTRNVVIKFRYGQFSGETTYQYTY